jgi:hypothetical protein
MSKQQKMLIGISKRTRNVFTQSEDEHLKELVNEFGTKNWDPISKLMGNRNERQCKERWEKYLSPTVNQGAWSKEEDECLIQLEKSFGRKWVKISSIFLNRTDVACKNRWNSLMQQQTWQKSTVSDEHFIQDFLNLEDPIPDSIDVFFWDL